MSKVVSVKKPFIYPNNSNFKLAVWEEWVNAGGQAVGDRTLAKYYKSLSYHLDLPTLWRDKTEARLCFCEGASLRFDTFPDYLTHEIIPMLWDCWPGYWDATEKWLRKHKVRTAIFTSSQTAEHFKGIFPEMNILHCPEAIETQKYKTGKPLKDRSIDYLEFGRCCKVIDSTKLASSIKVLSSRNEHGALATREQLIEALSDSKITIAFTRQDNLPDIAQGIDTLTQRYWECMLSGVVIIGRAPQELIDLIGYDPVIPLDKENHSKQFAEILNHIADYQELVDRNREVALRMGDWKVRMADVMEWLRCCMYEV